MEKQSIQDEEKLVLSSAYDEDITFIKNVWNVWQPIHAVVHLKPIESESAVNTAKNEVSLDFEVICCSKYPDVEPTLSVKNVKGISNDVVKLLLEELKAKCTELIGTPMIYMLSEHIRQFLYDKRSAPRQSFHESMLQKKAKEESELKDSGDIRVIAGRSFVVKDLPSLSRSSPHQYCSEWIGMHQGDYYLISEWRFHYTAGRQKEKKTVLFDPFMRKLEETEAHLKRFSQIIEHDQTIVPCSFVDVQRISTTNSNMNICTRVAQKLSLKENSCSHIKDQITDNPTLLRRLAAHCVCALRWLHDQGQAVVHGSLSINSIWHNDGSFRLSDAETLVHLQGLVQLFESIVFDIRSHSAEDRKSRKKDLFSLGTLLDNFSRGQSPSNSSTTAANDDLINFIKLCQSAKTIEELLDHPYLVIVYAWRSNQYKTRKNSCSRPHMMKTLRSSKMCGIEPTLSVKNVKGISNDVVKLLLEELKAKCTELIGTPMIYMLSEHIRQFLYDKRSAPRQSFHESMLQKKAKEESELKRLRLTSEKRELEEVVEEKERHLLEARFKKEAAEEDKLTGCDDSGDIRVIAGRSFVVKDLPSLSRSSPHQYCSEWIGMHQGDYYLISEWRFHYTAGRQKEKKTVLFDPFMRKLEETEAHLKRFSQIIEHDQTIVPCSFVDVQRISTTNSNMNICTRVAQKLSLKENSCSHIKDQITDNPTLLRRLAAHCVCALRWLHDQGQAVVHGSLSINSIWHNDGSFRLSDAETLVHLQGLVQLFESIVFDIRSHSAEDRKSRKKDLFSLGTLLDNFSRGQSPSNSSTTAANDDLINFIKLCQSAKTIEELLDHPYLVIDLLPSGSGSSATGGAFDGDAKGRIRNEFLVLNWLGKGGFGDVIHAKNKVDGNDYAIKRIPLNPKSESLNRRILREAKLFSKLNHPNVVRYYSAWVEHVNPTKKSKATPSPTPAEVKPHLYSGGDSLLPTKLRNLHLEAANPPVASSETSEWSTSYRQTAEPSNNSTDSDSSSSAHPVETIFSPIQEDSEYEMDIFFERSKKNDADDTSTSQDTASSKTTNGTTAPISTTVETATTGDNTVVKMLYIQMEYCEKSTLRHLIDNGNLTETPKTIWRIFGGILAGLSYIHKQGMIHRDIKPMNILLDGQERVKIGDFGLATRDLLMKRDIPGLALDPKMSGQTRDIGTELYMAPELFVLDDTSPYTSKIDVYSTGIVLFEMFYRPLPPGMDRIKTIRDLKDTVQLPSDFGDDLSDIQKSRASNFILSMLRRKSDERPTIEQLLLDDHLPVGDLDDENFQGTFLKLLNKRSGRMYNWMINELFTGERTAAMNYIFDQEICEDRFKNRHDVDIERTREQITKVFDLHSFSPLSSHMLGTLKSGRRVAGQRRTPVTLLDKSGFPVVLPLDLRQNFVRYCCRNAVYRTKRYAIDRVYRNKDILGGGVHPIERWECCLDCIGPVSSSVTLTVELLLAVCELITTCLSTYRCSLRIGHMGLLESILRHFSVPEDSRVNVINQFNEFTMSTKPLTSNEKIDLLTPQVGKKTAAAIVHFMHSSTSINEFKTSFKSLVRSRDSRMSEVSKAALNEMELIVQLLAEVADLNDQLDIVFDSSVSYRPSTFSDGFVFALHVEVQEKKTARNILVLAGGRYDSSLAFEHHPQDVPAPTPLCLIGCSISLEILAHLRKLGSSESFEEVSSCIVCSYSPNLQNAKFRLARELRSHEMATDILHEPLNSLDELTEFCNSSKIDHILVVYENNEVLIRTKGIDYGKVDVHNVSAHLMSFIADEYEGQTLSSRSMTTVTPTTSATNANCNVVFALTERPSYIVRKKAEGQVTTLTADTIAVFSSKTKIDVVVNNLPTNLIKSICGSISRTSTHEEVQLLFDSLSRQHGKCKEDLESVYAHLSQLFSSGKRGGIPVIILFSLSDSYFKVIV